MSTVKFPRTFPEDFTCVITHLQKTYPTQWPTPEVESLVEEAKAVARSDRDNAIEYYARTAKLIRETGWHA